MKEAAPRDSALDGEPATTLPLRLGDGTGGGVAWSPEDELGASEAFFKCSR